MSWNVKVGGVWKTLGGNALKVKVAGAWKTVDFAHVKVGGTWKQVYANFNAATGGTVTDVSNYNGTGETWRIHTFTSNGTFTVTNAPRTFSVLLVGGGGGGGGGCPPGFPAPGGYRGESIANTSVTLTTQGYSIVRGTGGGGGGFASPGGNGTSSTGFSLTARGGGGAPGKDCSGNNIGGNFTSYGTIASTITGTNVTYANGTYGNGGAGQGGAGVGGVVIVAYRIA